MNNILNIGEILTGILLIIFILLQRQSGGLSSIFGGSDETYRTKRGFEKNLFWATIALVALFIGIAIVKITIK